MALAPAHLNKSNHGHMLFVSILLETKIRLFDFYKKTTAARNSQFNLHGD